MPLHDWTRTPAGLFHDFHQSWSIRIKDALNDGLLPEGFSALVEQRSGPFESDVLAIDDHQQAADLEAVEGDIATVAPPKTSIIRRTDHNFYADRANRIVVRHHLGRVAAIIEIVSPGNKDRPAALRDFVEKTVAFLENGVHVLIIDPFPPTPRDPSGLHKAIWDEFGEDEPFEFPPGRDRLLASYETGKQRVAYIEPVGVGDELPAMPLFLTRGYHVAVPLESTYQTTWSASPAALRRAVEASAG